MTVCIYETFPLIFKRSLTLSRQNKVEIQSSPLINLFPKFGGNVEKKKKLAAVSRETPESTRSGRPQNILDPELTQNYISQVSEEIEGRVTKKFSKEFSRTESRILGALSKLDEFLLNPQVRICCVAVPGTSRNIDLENRVTNGDRPSDDPGPQVQYSSPHYGAETDPHMVTGATGELRQYPHMTMET